MDVSVGPSLDAAGFAEWAAARRPGLIRYAYVLTGSQAEAEDLVQSVLATLSGRWARVAAAGRPDAYARRMVTHRHISRWRRLGRREVLVAAPPDRPGADLADDVALADAVRRACATLPPRQRAAVVLRFWEDLDYRRIAAELGCRESTVRAAVHRGLAALRVELSREEADDA